MANMHGDRVLHLRSSGGHYGAEQVILNLARELNGFNCRNHIVCLNNSKNPHVELINEARAAGLLASSVNCRGLFDVRSVKMIRRMIKEEGIHIIHTHDYKATVFGLAASLGLNVRRVVTNHGWTNINFKLHCYQFIEGVLYNMFDRIVAVSNEGKKKISRYLFRADKVWMIENGICFCERKMEDGKGGMENPNRNHPLSIRDYPSSFTIGIVGRLSAEKGHAYLLKAFSRLLEKTQGHPPCKGEVSPTADKDTRTQVKTQGHNDTGTHETAQPVSCDMCHVSIKSCKLLIIGDGPLKADLENLCRELNLSFTDSKDFFHPPPIIPCPFSVIFTGVQKDMSAVYSAIDVLVMPSLQEGLPMTLLEAMAEGIPVIATPVGQIPEIVKDGETGFLVQPRGVKEIVDIIEKIMSLRAREPESLRSHIRAHEHMDTSVQENSGEQRQGSAGVLAKAQGNWDAGALDKIIENARQVVEEKYSARTMAEKYFKIYNENQ